MKRKGHKIVKKYSLLKIKVKLVKKLHFLKNNHRKALKKWKKAAKTIDNKYNLIYITKY